MTQTPTRRALPVMLLAALALAGGHALAAEPKSKASGGGGYLYKYKNDKGVMVIESAIPPEYASKGYQIITRSGVLVQEVPPSVTAPGAEGAAADKRQMDAQMARKDTELRKLYSSPQDAVRLRDRQLEALNIKVDFARGQLTQLTTKRKAELELAARHERRGKPVPAPMKENIERLNRQVGEQEAQVKALEADKEKIRADFQPIIERLNVIYPDKAIALDAPAATSAAPAAPAVAPATPAAPAKPAAR